MSFSSVAEVEHAMIFDAVHQHAKVSVRIKQIDDQGDVVFKRFETTPGRALLGSVLPLNAKTPFDIVNRLLRKKEVQEVIDTVYRYCGQKESVIFCDQIMAVGFREACNAGISFGKDDMLVPDNKSPIVEKTRKDVAGYEQQYWDGLITQGEKYNKVVDAWTKCSEDVATAMMHELSDIPRDADGAEMEPNTVYMMSHSGARGSAAQMKQLAGMRGLMTKPSGEIIETPIISNFKEGLNVLEYFTSTHGARKGLADTALKTANSGYLTRRLVDVAQDCIVRQEDCGTSNSIHAGNAVNDGEIVAPIGERILGRVAAEDVIDPRTKKTMLKRNTLIDELKAELIEKSGIQSVRIRSPADMRGRRRRVRRVLWPGSCAWHQGEHRRGDWHYCGPIDRGTWHPVDDADVSYRRHRPSGAAVVRGGVGSGNGRVAQPLKRLKIPKADDSLLDENMQLAINDENGNERVSYKLAYGAKLLVDEPQAVQRGDRLFEWDPVHIADHRRAGGHCPAYRFASGDFRDESDETTGITRKIVSDWRADPRAKVLKPRIVIVDPQDRRTRSTRERKLGGVRDVGGRDIVGGA